MRRVMFPLLAVAAVVLGLLIAWVDTRPGWDDTGVTVGVLCLASLCFGAIRPRQPWLWALLVGAWIPIFNIVLFGNYGALLALVFAGASAYAGAFGRKLLINSGAEAT